MWLCLFSQHIRVHCGRTNCLPLESCCASLGPYYSSEHAVAFQNTWYWQANRQYFSFFIRLNPSCFTLHTCVFNVKQVDNDNNSEECNRFFFSSFLLKILCNFVQRLCRFVLNKPSKQRERLRDERWAINWACAINCACPSGQEYVREKNTFANCHVQRGKRSLS